MELYIQNRERNYMQLPENVVPDHTFRYSHKQSHTEAKKMYVVVSFMVFDLTTGLCSVLGLMAKTLLIDKSIERMKLNKYFTIISSKPDEICEFIMNGLERSATVYHGEGVYSHKDKKIILTVVDVRQAVLLQRFIDEVDPQAFLMVTKSSEVVGKGFMSYI